MNFFDIIWFIFIIFAFTPVLQQKYLENMRIRTIRSMERKMNSRVITLIHRQETISFFGIPLSRYIDIDDSEQILRAIRLTEKNVPIDIILHTPGGLVLAAEQIAKALIRHPAPVRVFVPHYAMSGGTMLALAADEIYLDENAVLGPVDPQLGEYPAVSIIQAVREKGRENVDDRTLILADMSQKAINQVKSTIKQLLQDRMDSEKASFLADLFTSGKWTHDYPISYEEIKNLGISVRKDLPDEVYELMELYPQAGNRRPSVQFIPLPYKVPTKGNK
ncbi:SDH family Clp fold serine proteinase [Thermodesulfobium sp.]|jgi:ClpP class serine protease